ncbi:MAG: hypothetical protein SOX56_00960 [[Pasteurella] mairii]|nr:hypothetical protein [[Pasteurella] mairii]
MKEITDKERLDFLQNKRVVISKDGEDEGFQLCIHYNGIIEDLLYCKDLRGGIDMLMEREG